MLPLCPDVHRNVCTSARWCLYTSETLGKTFDWQPAPRSPWKRDRDSAPTTNAHPQTGVKASTSSWVCRTALLCLHRLGREGEAALVSRGAWRRGARGDMQTRLLLQLMDGIFLPVTHFQHFGWELQRLQKKGSDLAAAWWRKRKTQAVQNSVLVLVWFHSFVLKTKWKVIILVMNTS